jgi:hypothetical protein
VILHFDYKYDDFDASKWWRPGMRGRPEFRRYLGCLALVAAGVLLESAGTVELAVKVNMAWGLAGLLPIFFVLLMVVSLRRTVLKRNHIGTPEAWARNPFSRLPTTVEIAADVVCFDIELYRQCMHWSAVQAIFKNSYGILVHIRGGHDWLIPMRVFKSPQHENDFMRLLASYYARPIIEF